MPSRSTGPNGLPVATSACPSVQASRFVRGLLGEHGRVRHRQDDRPGAVLVHRADDLLGEGPGDAGRADEHRRVEAVDDLLEAQGAVGRAPSGHRGGVLGVRLLVVVQVGHVAREQTRAVEQEDPVGRLLRGQPVLGHRQRDEVGDADSRRPRAEHDDLLVDQAAPGDAHPGQDAREADRGRALDVVVERAQGVAVLREDPPRRRPGEVLPVQDRLREVRRGAGDVGVDERLVRLAAHPGTPQPEVAGVVEQHLAVRAHVEADGQHPAGVDAGRDGVDRELADRDVDPADAPVADAEDRLGVGRHHEVDVVRAEAGGVQGRVDAVDVLDVEEHAAGAAEEVAELLDGRPDRGGVDDRQHLVDVLTDEPVEQHLVVVVQVGEEGPLLDVGLGGLELLVGPRHLLVERLQRGGSSPCSPRWSRSAMVKAVPRLTCGSSRTAMPRAWISTWRDASGPASTVYPCGNHGAASSICAWSRPTALRDHTDG